MRLYRVDMVLGRINRQRCLPMFNLNCNHVKQVEPIFNMPLALLENKNGSQHLIGKNGAAAMAERMQSHIVGYFSLSILCR